MLTSVSAKPIHGFFSFIFGHIGGRRVKVNIFREFLEFTECVSIYLERKCLSV